MTKTKKAGGVGIGKFYRRAITWTLLWLALPGPVGASEIRVAGSDLLGGDFSRAAREFSARHDQPLRLALDGTRPALDLLAAGGAEVGLVMLPPGEFPPRGLINVVVGYQVAVVAVPSGSALTQITRERLRKLFGAGDDSEAKKSMHLLALSPRAGLALSLFEQLVLEGHAASSGVELMETEDALLKRLHADTQAVAITGRSDGVRVLALAKSATEPAYAPTAEAVHRGDYPLRLPLYAMFRRSEAAGLQGFLRFLLSDEAADALAAADFIPLPAAARDQLLLELETMR